MTFGGRCVCVRHMMGVLSSSSIIVTVRSQLEEKDNDIQLSKDHLRYLEDRRDWEAFAEAHRVCHGLLGPCLRPVSDKSPHSLRLHSDLLVSQMERDRLEEENDVLTRQLAEMEAQVIVVKQQWQSQHEAVQALQQQLVQLQSPQSESENGNSTPHRQHSSINLDEEAKQLSSLWNRSLVGDGVLMDDADAAEVIDCFSLSLNSPPGNNTWSPVTAKVPSPSAAVDLLAGSVLPEIRALRDALKAERLVGAPTPAHLCACVSAVHKTSSMISMHVYCAGVERGP
jgi:hypothetical protein